MKVSALRAWREGELDKNVAGRQKRRRTPPAAKLEPSPNQGQASGSGGANKFSQGTVPVNLEETESDEGMPSAEIRASDTILPREESNVQETDSGPNEMQLGAKMATTKSIVVDEQNVFSGKYRLV